MAAHKDHTTGTTDLHCMLLKAVPPDAAGKKSIIHLAKLLKISRSSIWKWIKRGKIPPDRAVDVVDVSEGEVTLADFSRFIYNR